jgi:broad specificity phosphatase PhoE
MLTAPVRTMILMVRHAEVQNPKDMVYGRLPRFGLSRQGQNQAEMVARFLSTRNADVIYTSSLLRARQTASVIAAQSPAANVRRSKSLIEVLTGHQGSPNSILVGGFSFYTPVKCEGDESMEDVLTRMTNFLRLAVKRHAGREVIAVSHADPIAILRLGLEGKPLTVENLHTVVYPERVSINQIVLGPDHLPQLTYFDVARSMSSAA